MRTAIVTLLVSLLALPAAGGEISGVIANPGQCQGVQALLRKGPGVKYPAAPRAFPAEFDAATGAFHAQDLPDGLYDLRALVPGGSVDGVDMRLEQPDHEDDPFGPEDEKALRDFVANYPDAFSDVFRVLAIRGNPQYARILVEKIRAREFHSGKQGEITWRIEVWSMEKQTGAWVRSRRSTTTVNRLRVFTGKPQRNSALQTTWADFEKLVSVYAPDMGGFELEDNGSVTGLKITLPEISEANGKVAGSVKKQVEEYHKKNPQPYLE